MSLNYLPRSAWNARASKGPTHLNATGLLGTALHWPGMGNRRLFAQADVARALRGWQDYHMDPTPKGRGWSDIAYQVAVDQAGRVWTLRGLTTRSGANGDEDANAAYGAILLVLGTGETPTGALINSTRAVIADFRRLYPKATAIKPHSWVRTHYTGTGTDCPGDPARALIAAGQFNPTTTTTPEGGTLSATDAQRVIDYTEQVSIQIQAHIDQMNDDYARRAAAELLAPANLDKIATAVAAKLSKA